MSRISRLFFQGLAAVLPIVISIFTIYWLANKMESGLGALFQKILPKAYYVPGMGVAAGIVLVMIAGLAMEFWLVRKLFRFGERILERIPLLKTVYGGVQDLLSFFSGEREQGKDQAVVMVEVQPGIELLGLVTRQELQALPTGMAQGNADDRVAVYMPMSYQIGGYTAFVPREKIRAVEMNVEDAMRFAVTAGMSTDTKKGEGA